MPAASVPTHADTGSFLAELRRRSDPVPIGVLLDELTGARQQPKPRPPMFPHDPDKERRFREHQRQWQRRLRYAGRCQPLAHSNRRDPDWPVW